MRNDRPWPLGVLFALTFVFAGAVMYADDTVVRWDIVNLPPFCPEPGGEASAQTHHNDNSKITMTGSGTFDPKEFCEPAQGGGTWTTFNSAGVATGGGTYQVTQLVSWHRAPGALNCPNDPTPGVRAAGHANLRIVYSDGSHGILTISCRLAGTPNTVFEGIAVSKDFVDYTHNVEPTSGVNANRTLFHIQEEE